jgi:hypothetical protein
MLRSAPSRVKVNLPRVLAGLLLTLAAGACRQARRARAPAEAGVAAARPSPCSASGYREGPALHRAPGDLAFEVFQNCLWPGDARLAIGVHLTGRTPPGRSQVGSLLEHLWAQARSGLGARFPRHVQICAFDRPGGWSTDFVGCLTRGFEPMAEDEETTDAGEEVPELENRARFSPVEEAERIENVLAAGFSGPRRPRVAADAARHRLVVTYPFVAPATGRWLARPGCADAIASFLQAAWTFYPVTTELTAFEFEGVWRDRPLLGVEVPSEAAFLAMDPWPLRERLGRAPPERLAQALDGALTRLRREPGASAALDRATCAN